MTIAASFLVVIILCPQVPVWDIALDDEEDGDGRASGDGPSQLAAQGEEDPPLATVSAATGGERAAASTPDGGKMFQRQSQ